MNTLQKDAHCVCVCSGVARRIMVRDMGNGVDRIEMCGFTSLEAAKDECRLPDRTPLSYSTDRLTDICYTAAEPPSSHACGDCIQTGAMRGIDDSAFEMLVWRVE